MEQAKHSRTLCSLAAALATTFAFFWFGCGEPVAVPPASSDLLPPLTGDIIVAANTDGSDLDPNGYTRQRHRDRHRHLRRLSDVAK